MPACCAGAISKQLWGHRPSPWDTVHLQLGVGAWAWWCYWAWLHHFPRNRSWQGRGRAPVLVTQPQWVMMQDAYGVCMPAKFTRDQALSSPSELLFDAFWCSCYCCCTTVQGRPACTVISHSRRANLRHHHGCGCGCGRHLPWWWHAFEWGRWNLKLALCFLSFLVGGPVGWCLQNVHVGEQGVAQANLFGHRLVEIDDHIAESTHDCGIQIGGRQDAIAAERDLLVWVGDPGHIPVVLEQHNVGGIEADGSVTGVLIKDVLDKVSDECFIMKRWL